MNSEFIDMLKKLGVKVVEFDVPDGDDLPCKLSLPACEHTQALIDICRFMAGEILYGLPKYVAFWSENLGVVSYGWKRANTDCHAWDTLYGSLKDSCPDPELVPLYDRLKRKFQELQDQFDSQESHNDD